MKPGSCREGSTAVLPGQLLAGPGQGTAPSTARLASPSSGKDWGWPLHRQNQHGPCLSPPLGQLMNLLDFSTNVFETSSFSIWVFFSVFCLLEALSLMYYDCFMH